MDTVSPICQAAAFRPDMVITLAAHLLRYPHDLVDAKRLIQKFRASAPEFAQALLILEHKPTTRRGVVDGD